MLFLPRVLDTFPVSTPESRGQTLTADGGTVIEKSPKKTQATTPILFFWSAKNVLKAIFQYNQSQIVFLQGKLWSVFFFFVRFSIGLEIEIRSEQPTTPAVDVLRTQHPQGCAPNPTSTGMCSLFRLIFRLCSPLSLSLWEWSYQTELLDVLPRWNLGFIIMRSNLH